MQTWMIAVIVVVALAVVVGALWAWSRQRRTERLTRQYGPEYEAAIEERGDRAAAERELESRMQRVRKLDIVPLSAEQRDRFAEEWRSTQADFVDDPSGSIAKADRLVQEVMAARGYPTGDFDQRAADVSVDHPQVVAEYRAAHEIATRHASDGVDTEELRRALVHYRALFADLLETGSTTDERTPAAAGGVR